MIPATALEAFRLIEPDIPTIQERIMFLVERSPDGLTSLDLEPIFRVSAVRRLSELRDQGRVEFRCSRCLLGESRHNNGNCLSVPGNFVGYERFTMITRQGLSGAHRGVYYAGGRPIAKVPCPLCQTKVPASRIGAAQVVLL